MKKFSMLFIFLLIYVSFVFAEVTLENNMEIYGTWTKENNPYIISGKVTIPRNRTLVIEKGVTVKLKTGTYYDFNDINFDVGLINVQGNIVVNGTKNDPVIFTRSNNRGNWGIIYIDSGNPNNIFNYAIIEYASKIENISRDSSDNRGAITLFNAMCNFNNCILRNNSCFGILLYMNSNINVSYCTFFNNEMGINKWFKSFVNIENSIFWENEYTFWGYDEATFLIKNSIIQLNNNDDKDYTLRVISDLGSNKYNVDPLFTNDSCILLRNNSPCRRMSSNGKTIGAFQN